MDMADHSVNFGALYNIEPARLSDYARHFMSVDVWNPALNGLPARQAYLSQVLVDEAVLRRSEFYNDFLQPQGIHHALGGFVLRSGSQVFLCGVQRERRAQPFGTAEARQLNRLFPHLERAAKLHGNLAAAGGLTEGLAAALERLPQAAILVDGSGRIIWANHLGEEQLRRTDGIRLRDGRIEASMCAAATNRLLHMLADAEGLAIEGNCSAPAGLLGSPPPGKADKLDMAAYRPHRGPAKRNGDASQFCKGRDHQIRASRVPPVGVGRIDIAAPRVIRPPQVTGDGDAGGLLLVPRVWPLRPLTMSVTPLVSPRRRGDVMPGIARPAALLLIHDPDRTVPLPAERLCRVFGLTPAEARLAAALAGGSTLGQYADRARIKIGTARWYLKQVLAKTGAHRQSELVRNVIATVGIGAGQLSALR
jgi:DNA-binding CsgD family transcriptional regulator/PAS domain-containing protein